MYDMFCFNVLCDHMRHAIPTLDPLASVPFTVAGLEARPAPRNRAGELTTLQRSNLDRPDLMCVCLARHRKIIHVRSVTEKSEFQQRRSATWPAPIWTQCTSCPRGSVLQASGQPINAGQLRWLARFPAAFPAPHGACPATGTLDAPFPCREIAASALCDSEGEGDDL